MNIINWWSTRRQQAQAKRQAKLDAIKAKDAEELAENEKNLRAHVKAIRLSLAMVGIRPCDKSTTNRRYTVATFICVGPDDKPYEAEVGNTGGYTLTKIK